MHCICGFGADAPSHPLRGGLGLGAWGLLLLLLQGFGEALQSQVVVPHLGESLILLVQADKVNVVVADDIAAPLLHAYIVVPVILCEAPDYVKWSRDARPMRSFTRGSRLRYLT